MPKAQKTKSTSIGAPAKTKASAKGSVVAASKPNKQASSASKAPKEKAVVLKAPKKTPKIVAVSDDEPPSAPGSDGSEDEDAFPDDGMHFGTSDDDQPTGQVKELIAELDDGMDSDEDEAMDDEEQEQDDTNALATKLTQRKHAKEMQLTTGMPMQLAPKKKRAAHVSGAPCTPAKAAAAVDSSAAALDFTPYANRINPKDPSKPLLSLQTPTTRNIVKKAQHLVRADIATHHAFPDDDARIEFAERSIIRVAKDIGADRRVLRLERDPVYHDALVKLVIRSGTQIRGETVNTARDIVGAQYNLAAEGTSEQIKLYVEFLLSNGNFLYRRIRMEKVDPKTIRCIERSGPYRHDVMDTVLAQEFFHGHERMALAEDTAALFNPMPLAAVAFAATAVQCALRDWATGVRVKSSASFTADEWSDIYNGHLRELERIRAAKPVEVDTWMRSSWKKAWTTTRQHLNNGAPKPSFITAAELDDFSDIMADA